MSRTSGCDSSSLWAAALSAAAPSVGGLPEVARCASSCRHCAARVQMRPSSGDLISLRSGSTPLSRLGGRTLDEVGEQLEPRGEQHRVSALGQDEQGQDHVDDADLARGAAVDAHLLQAEARLARVDAEAVGEQDERGDLGGLVALPRRAHALLELDEQLVAHGFGDPRLHEDGARERHVACEALGDAPHAQLAQRRPGAEAQLAVRATVTRLKVLEPLREHARRVRLVQQRRHAARLQRVGPVALLAREDGLHSREAREQLEQRHGRRRPLGARPRDERPAEVAEAEAEESVDVGQLHQELQHREARPLGAALV
eukprot:scaffold14799_cov63-Phaeocystis_antarctica.AAC.2